MKKKILIVEDNNDSLEIMNLFITGMGHQAIKANSNHENEVWRFGLGECDCFIHATAGC